MDQLIPAMYDQWSDPEINFDDIVNESFYRSSVNSGDYDDDNENGGVGGNDHNNGTEQLNDFNTCSIITKNEFIYDEDYDNDNNDDDEITITAENTSFEYKNLSSSSSYGFIPYFDAMQQNSMVTSFTSTMVWHSKGADLKMYHGKDSCSSSSNNNRASGLSSHLSGDAIPFVPTAQSKTSKSTFF